ncbi:MAG: DPP IV N-terminal domain-containing protein [Limisphaerales bacterium]
MHVIIRVTWVWTAVAFLLALGRCPAWAEEAATNDVPALTIATLFEKNEFSAKGHSGSWADDSSGYYRSVDSASTQAGQDIVLIDPESGSTNLLVAAQDLIPPGQDSPLSVASYAFSTNRSKLLIFTNTRRVWRHNDRGDYWVLDRSSLELRQLGGDAPPSSLMHAKLSPDGTQAGYVRDRNLFVEDLRTGAIRQLTKTDGDEMIHGAFDWVYEEEFEMRDGWRWSPDGRAMAFWQIDTTGVRRFPLIDNVSGLYPEVQWITYPKTGERNSAARVGVVAVDTGVITWLKIPGDPRENYIHSVEWPATADGIQVQQLNRLQNTNRLFLVHPTTGAAREVFIQSDAAWVDVRTRSHWTRVGDRVPWLSERDGWNRWYAIDAATGGMKALYDDPLDVAAAVHFVESTGEIYFLASPTNATQRYLYRTSIQGGHPERITPADQPGTHGYQISPDGKWALHTWASFGVPPTADLVRLPEHRQVRVLEDNQKLKDKLAQLNLPPVEFFRVPITDDLETDAYCLKPADFDSSKKYPLIVFVYGEPAGQTVTDTWHGTGGLWHRLLANEGFVVMSFDNRGTPAPRGRAWRKSVYRQVGILAPADQAAALEHTLDSRPYLDRERVGIWGWSGGGSMTLNALLKYPKLYQAGIAVAAVPNMRLYDTIYQERYMGLPDDNVDGYRNGSPLHFAHQLEGSLLIVHGTGDDNVHYQGMEALVDRLVHHKKQFEMLVYPNRTHSISEGQNTSAHLRQAMLDFWKRRLSIVAKTDAP